MLVVNAGVVAAVVVDVAVETAYVVVVAVVAVRAEVVGAPLVLPGIAALSDPVVASEDSMEKILQVFL